MTVDVRYSEIKKVKGQFFFSTRFKVMSLHRGKLLPVRRQRQVTRFFFHHVIFPHSRFILLLVLSPRPLCRHFYCRTSFLGAFFVNPQRHSDLLGVFFSCFCFLGSFPLFIEDLKLMWCRGKVLMAG